ncbi:Ca(2+)-dependent cysteine protease [Gryganskiella cystojenkinii]|nr:Ca(2+)-dependent cysteine protease [Gryganskiella cystojenkinii]
MYPGQYSQQQHQQQHQQQQQQQQQQHHQQQSFFHHEHHQTTQQHYGPPPGNPPPQGFPYGAYPPPVQGAYGAPPPGHYGPPPGQPHYPPPASSPYGYAPPSHPPPPQQQYAPPPFPPQHMIAPQSVPPPPTGWAVHQSPDRLPPTNFQLSNCQGRKRALFVGINYFGQQNELRGCINDVKNIKTFIMRQFGFREEDTIALTDDQKDPSRIPTHANILAAMKWLVKDARPNDSFFFHYSGHGGQTEDRDGDEDDGYDETIYPVDHERAGVIIDDTMHELLVRPLPAGCRLTAIMDCCHSGSALDLPFIYSTTGNLKEANLMADVGKGALSAGMAYMKGDMGGVLKGLGGLGKKLMAPKRDKTIEKKASPADCIMLSGCKDTQTSADAHEQGFGMTGAMTFSFITALTANPQQSYLQLLNSIRDVLRSKYEQKPQLSSSHPVDLNLIFTM